MANEDKVVSYVWEQARIAGKIELNEDGEEVVHTDREWLLEMIRAHEKQAKND